ncbi:MAG: HD-GYP domain-containing protein [Burkholderiaceae bacterium]|jgi:HD-GYP domain-containing protein (c-di-GMP phosphodiesterase class II)
MDLGFTASDVMGKSVAELVKLVDSTDEASAFAVADALLHHGNEAMKSFSSEKKALVDHVSSVFMQVTSSLRLESRVQFLCACCFYYDRIGSSYQGVDRGEAARKLASQHRLRNLERRACNSLAIAYVGFADFELACQRLEQSVVLAAGLKDPFLTCNALSQTTLLLKEMGLYRDAMEVADKCLAFAIDTDPAKHVQFNAAGNGLFCAHRLGDEVAGLRYLRIGTELLDNPAIDPTSRVSFEYFRVLYLLTHHDFETAEMLVTAARNQLGQLRNPRVEILLDLCDTLCDWESGEPGRKMDARNKKLRELYHRSKALHLQHDEVLRVLTQIYGSSSNPEDAERGIGYAKELVEYVTSIKRAKFFRQLTDRGVELETESAHVAPELDPLGAAKRWLGLPGAHAYDRLFPIEQPIIEKHDELYAVHDDLARMRTAALRNSMRTVAYDTAENWALAAEFFDDETGQHCFRVGYLAGMLAREIGMDEEFCLRVEHAARLHDIGKIGVNELILLKPGPLDPAELMAMRAHAEVGSYLLQGTRDPTLEMAAVIAEYHHEWWNGTGYPKRLSRQTIPLPARICALADVYDALTNRRSYKPAWSHRTAVEQMVAESEVHFDPELISPFLKVLEKYVSARDSGRFTEMQGYEMRRNGLLSSRRKLMAAVHSQA